MRRQAPSRIHGLGYAGFMPWLVLAGFVYAHRICGRGALNSDVSWLMTGPIACGSGGAQSQECTILSTENLQRSGFGGERLRERTASAALSYCHSESRLALCSFLDPWSCGVKNKIFFRTAVCRSNSARMQSTEPTILVAIGLQNGNFCRQAASTRYCSNGVGPVQLQV